MHSDEMALRFCAHFICLLHCRGTDFRGIEWGQSQTQEEILDAIIVWYIEYVIEYAMHIVTSVDDNIHVLDLVKF